MTLPLDGESGIVRPVKVRAALSPCELRPAGGQAGTAAGAQNWHKPEWRDSVPLLCPIVRAAVAGALPLLVRALQDRRIPPTVPHASTAH